MGPCPQVRRENHQALQITCVWKRENRFLSLSRCGLVLRNDNDWSRHLNSRHRLLRYKVSDLSITNTLAVLPVLNFTREQARFKSMNLTTIICLPLSNSLFLKIFTAHVFFQVSSEALKAKKGATACCHCDVVDKGALARIRDIAAAREIFRLSNKTGGKCQGQSNNEFGRSAKSGLRIKTNGGKKHSMTSEKVLRDSTMGGMTNSFFKIKQAEIEFSTQSLLTHCLPIHLH